MIARKDDTIFDYIREQRLGMAAALLTEMYKKCDTVATLGLFRKWLQGASTAHSYLVPTLYMAEHIPCFLKKMNAF